MTIDNLKPLQPRRPKLGIAVPLANEESTIAEFLRQVVAHLEGGDRLFCVLDGKSRDKTREIVAAASEIDERVVLVWAPENRCVVDAYFRGYKAAYDDGCEWILEMDGGFSHLPEQIPQFLAAMAQGYEYVGGSRFMPGGSHQSPWTRIFISKGGTVLASWVLKSQMTDMTSGFECFSRKAMAHVLQKGVASRANFFQTEIRHMMHQFKWLEVPITYRNTMYSVGRNSVREALRVLWSLRSEAQKQQA